MGEEPARIPTAAVPVGVRSHEHELDAPSRREPCCELEGGPVVLAAAERNEDLARDARRPYDDPDIGS
jgi:hypothetical protein